MKIGGGGGGGGEEEGEQRGRGGGWVDEGRYEEEKEVEEGEEKVGVDATGRMEGEDGRMQQVGR